MHELRAEDLAWRCPDDWLEWDDLEAVERATTIVGQDRAVEAIAFGLEMEGIGYNVFVTGLSGTGRLTTIKRFVDQMVVDSDRPDDVCFVANFRVTEEPVALFLKAGAGRRFREGMDGLVEQLEQHIPTMLGDADFRQRVERAVADLRQRERELVSTFESEVRAAGFQMVQIQVGPVSRPEILPVIGDVPVPVDELRGLVDQGKIEASKADELEKLHDEFSGRLLEVFQTVSKLRAEAQGRVEKVQLDLLGPAIDELVAGVEGDVADERAASYFKSLRQDIRDHLELLTPSNDADGEDRFQRWRVNLAVDNADSVGRPVVLETEPSYSNLFGTIERSLTPTGEPVTSFLKIRAGSLLRANGGFLVLNAEDLLTDSRVWSGLKRALKYRRVQIQSLESVVLGAAALKPQPVALDVKVVVIGDRGIFDALYRYDPDFSKIFKVLADFDSVMPATKATARDVLSVLRKVVDEEHLLTLDRSAMAAMLEHAIRLGRWRRRFSSRFSDLSDLARESSHVARRRGAKSVTRGDVEAAHEAHHRRHSLSEDRTHDLLTEGVIRIDTDGTAVGCVNGLAVYDLGHYRYGKPSRISAQVGVGKDGIINVERQAGLSGPTHDKGVQILTGFLRGVFARRFPLSMSCSITFEQSYGGIDGDSASSAEIYAILSSLSEIPLRQDVAVTGSVDQHGRVQAIGGVNEKIEGFFRVCSRRGLTGHQGVMIPASNVDDLHLANEVVDAAASGQFHVWSVASIDEGIELLTGLPAGRWTDDGWEPADGVFGRCFQRLDDMARSLRQAGKEPDGKDGGVKHNDVQPDDPVETGASAATRRG